MGHQGGYLPGVLGGGDTEIPALQNVAIPTPSEDILPVSPVQITNAELSFGSLLSFCNIFANDFVMYADGINPLQLYNNKGRAYRAGLVAPADALTATSSASVSAIMRPETNETGVGCGVTEDSTAMINHWVDNDGNAWPRATYPEKVCDAYQAVYNSEIDDDGYVVLDESVNVGLGGLNMQTRFKMSSLSYTPDTGFSATIRVRAKYIDVGTPATTTNVNVYLYQGHPVNDVGAFIVHETNWTEADLTTSFANYDLTVTSGEADTITDWTKLYVVLEIETGVSTNYRRVQVSQVYLTATTSGSAGLATGVYTYVYTYVREATGCESGPSPELQYTHDTSGPVLLNDITFSTDTTVTHINIYRTPIGGGTFHLVTTVPNDEDQAIPNPTLGIEDAIQDITLTGTNSIRLDADRKRIHAALLPPRGRYLALYQNRVFTGGALLSAPYIAGTASFTVGSKTVTGVGTYWTSDLEGRAIRVTSTPNPEPYGFLRPGGYVDQGQRDNTTVINAPVAREKQEVYRILKVNSRTSITLTQAFEQDSVNGAEYEILDDRNPFMLSWSAPGFPEDWPVAFGLELASDTGDGITGMVPHLAGLIIFTRDRIYRLVGEDESNFVVQLMFQGTGCVSGHTIQVYENLIYFQGIDGWYTYDGGTGLFPISSPPMQDIVARGLDRTVDTIVGSRERTATSIFNRRTKTVQFYTSMGELENNKAAVYDTTNGAWTLDDAPNVVSVDAVFNQYGDEIILAGDIMGNVWQLDVGNSDGAFTGTVVADVTSGSKTLVTCSGASFTTTGDGLSGVPAYLLSSTGTLYRFIISTNTATALYPLDILPITPDDTYQVIVGAIPWEVATGHVNYGLPHKDKVLEYIEIVYNPNDNHGHLYVLGSEDFGSLSYVSHDNTDLTPLTATISLTGTGVGRVFNRRRGRHMKTVLRGFVPGHDIKVASFQHFLLVDTERGAQGGGQ